MSELSSAASLRHLLMKMEASLGLKELSPSERDVFYAVVAVAETKDDFVKSEEVRTHESLCNMPLPTIYRALSDLVKDGYLNLAPGAKRGLFRLP